MASIIQIRRDTASNWTSANPTLAQGELGIETDTLKVKAGDGSTAWTSASYLIDTGGYAAYSDTTANFTGTLQNGGSNVVVDSDIGSTVQAYDATILVDADIGSSVQAFDADTTKNDVANTFTANQAITAELIANSYNETYAAVTSTSNATTVNCEAGNAFSHTLTENTTFTFSNPPASGTAFSFSLELIQDASASGYTVTWPTAVDWPAATAPTLTATASAKDIFVFYTRDGGTTWYGFTAGQALA
jgi:hypothetical protein